MADLKGGYFMADCTGLNLASSEQQSITGIWQLAKSALASDKPIYAYNCTYGSGVPMSPVPVFGWYISTTEIVIVGATLHVHITSADKATVLDVAA